MNDDNRNHTGTGQARTLASTGRRNFLARTAAVATLPAVPAALHAAIPGNADTRSWAVSSDPGIWSQAWAARFTNPLVNPLQATPLGVAGSPTAFYKPDAGTTNRYTIQAVQATANVLGLNGRTTKVWGYKNYETAAPTYPGRSFEVQRDQAITVAWRNQLSSATGPLPHLLPVDQTITIATPSTGVPLAVHHHGSNAAPEFDGGPDQWTTPVRRQVGPGVSAANLDPAGQGLLYQYLNTQEASLHWYHDHAESVTRINVHAGLAGLYVIRDANEALMQGYQAIPKAPYEIGLVLQDRCFDANGNFTYAADPAQYPQPITIPNNQPTHFPEMFGDVMVVNGKAWPNAVIEPRPYRIRLLNGSDSRFYVLDFGVPTYQIGTDLGLMNNAVPVGTVTIAPGERKDLVLDFTGRANGSFVVTNSAATPFPDGDPPTGGMTQVMRFQTSLPLNTAVPLTAGALLPAYVMRVPRPGTQTLLTATQVATTAAATPTVRRVLLGEGEDQYGRITPMLGTYHPTNAALNRGTLTFADAPTETPKVGATEVWEFWNTTVDAHPVHMHLVGFQIVDRRPFAGTVVATTMSNGWIGVKLTGPVSLGAVTPVPATEVGFKDTVVCPPGQVTRVLVTFPRAGKYVYHCHILSHEEHDMMRWYQVS